MDDVKSYITIDQHGVRRVSGTRISIDSVAISFQDGASPEEIQRNFPELSLEQVYGAIAYYLGHRKDVDEYLRGQRAQWEHLRAEQEKKPNAAVERLRQLRSSEAGHAR